MVRRYVSNPGNAKRGKKPLRYVDKSSLEIADGANFCAPPDFK